MDTFQIALIVAGLIFIVGLFGLFYKIQMSSKTTVIFKRTFGLLFFVLLVATILSQFNVYFRGYWTTKFFVWLFIVTASLLFTIGKRQALTRLWRIFTGTIFYFPVASILWFLIVPFMGPILSISIWGHILGSTDDTYYSDSEIRIQRVFTGALGSSGPPNYFRKSGILEFDKGTMQVEFNEKPDSLKVDKTKDTVTAYFYYNGRIDKTNPVLFKFKK